MSTGIDYGRGLTNIDLATGIRYGVISQHALASWFFDEFEASYGAPACPECGGVVVDSSSDEAAGVVVEAFTQYGYGCADYLCVACELEIDSSDCYSDEPIGHSLDGDGYKAIDCLDSDVMIVLSPFYTYGPFCSPCVPGGVSLPDDRAWPAGSGARAYCFSHDWFEDGIAPYVVYRVSDDAIVDSEKAGA